MHVKKQVIKSEHLRIGNDVLKIKANIFSVQNLQNIRHLTDNNNILA